MMNDVEFFRDMLEELGGQVAHATASDIYNDGEEDEQADSSSLDIPSEAEETEDPSPDQPVDAMLSLSEEIQVILRHEPARRRFLCYARLGEISRPATFLRLLAANGRTLPRRVWFSHERATGQALVSCVLYRGTLSPGEGAERIRQFIAALVPWRDAIATAEHSDVQAGGDDSPPDDDGPLLPPDGPGFMFVRV